MFTSFLCLIFYFGGSCDLFHHRVHHTLTISRKGSASLHTDHWRAHEVSWELYFDIKVPLSLVVIAVSTVHLTHLHWKLNPPIIFRITFSVVNPCKRNCTRDVIGESFSLLVKCTRANLERSPPMFASLPTFISSPLLTLSPLFAFSSMFASPPPFPHLLCLPCLLRSPPLFALSPTFASRADTTVIEH